MLQFYGKPPLAFFPPLVAPSMFPLLSCYLSQGFLQAPCSSLGYMVQHVRPRGYCSCTLSTIVNKLETIFQPWKGGAGRGDQQQQNDVLSLLNCRSLGYKKYITQSVQTAWCLTSMKFLIHHAIWQAHLRLRHLHKWCCSVMRWDVCKSPSFHRGCCTLKKSTYLWQPLPCRLNEMSCLLENAAGAAPVYSAAGWFLLNIIALLFNEGIPGLQRMSHAHPAS